MDAALVLVFKVILIALGINVLYRILRNIRNRLRRKRKLDLWNKK